MKYLYIIGMALYVANIVYVCMFVYGFNTMWSLSVPKMIIKQTTYLKRFARVWFMGRERVRG